MIIHIALVAEILATIICIHCIYGRRVELDVRTIAAILGILIILEIANLFPWGGIFSLFGYIILFVYCKIKFESSVKESIVSLVLCIIILTSVQFVCMFIVSIIKSDVVYVRNAICNTLVLILFFLLKRTNKLHQLQRGICSHNTFVLIILSFMSLVVIIILLQGKTSYEVDMEYFILVIPAIIILMYIIVRWYLVQTKSEELENVIQNLNEDRKEYDKLLVKVRLRQHEFKNHMAAIFSAHYTHKTYEKLVRAQEEYCAQMLKVNKYNNLILLDNKVLVGYLYGKFQEAEDDGIEIKYKVAARIDKSQVPIYYVIEMLGILFDNSMEALKTSEEKKILFEVRELEKYYEFSIMNPFLRIPYEEIVKWFKLGKSEKGAGRGLGLYHLKCLCEEWNSDIICRNMEIGQNNWIEFRLKIVKADNE